MKNEKKITIIARDPDNTLEDILNAIKEIGNTGHGFDIELDREDDAEYDEGAPSFYWDGDGSDSIRSIDVEKVLEESLKEDITLDIDKGDTILTGRFKNHKVEVKDIGEDEHGMPTVNDKQITKIRIPKLEESAYLKSKDNNKMKEQDRIKKVLILLEAQVDKEEKKKKEPLKEGVLDQLAQLWVSNAHTVTPDMPDGLVFKLAVGLVLGIAGMTIAHYKWNDIVAYFKKSPDKAQEVVKAAKAVQSSNSVGEVKQKLGEQGINM